MKETGFCHALLASRREAEGLPSHRQSSTGWLRHPVETTYHSPSEIAAVTSTASIRDQEEGRTVDVTEIWTHGSMHIGEGIDDDGHLVTFAAEYRYGYEIADALDAGEDVVAFIPDHMVLRRQRAAHEIRP